MSIEQFPEGEELEELNIHVLEKIVLNLRELAKKVSLSLPSREELRKRLNIRKIVHKPYITRLKAYYIDGSYSEPALELLGGCLAVYAVGYVSSSGEMSIEYGGATIVDDQREISRLVTALEHKLAIKLLEDKRHGIRDFDIIVHDGPINSFPGEPFTAARKYVDLIRRELELAEKTNTIIVGIPKVTRATYAAALLSLVPEIDKVPPVIPDRALATYVLERGEYAVLGKLRDVLPTYAEYLKRYRKKKVPDDPLELVKEVPQYGDIVLVLMRTASGLRVEIYDPTGELVDDVVSYIYWETGQGSSVYPYLHDRVDQLVRVRLQDTLWAYTVLLENIKDPDTVLGLLALANPQKAYLYRRR